VAYFGLFKICVSNAPKETRKTNGILSNNLYYSRRLVFVYKSLIAIEIPNLFIVF